MRLPKEAYFALQATWAKEDRVHLIGHWSYPDQTEKPIYAVAKADKVELFVNGKSQGFGQKSMNTLFTWPAVKFEPGEIKVVASRDGAEIATQTKQTAGEPAAIRLTPMTSPSGWRADGSDVALVDFEVVDSQGRRCPTDQARVDFEVSGVGVWRGGYNSGTEDSTNHLYLDTECGINRVSIRSTLEAGEVVVTARRAGLEPATLTLKSTPVTSKGGISSLLPVVFDTSLPERPEIDGAKLAELTELRNAPPTALAQTPESDRMFSMFAYTGNGVGGMENSFREEMLAFSDDARIYIKELPEFLKDSQVIRTAKIDSAYWANDYIVATAGRELDLYVAHDPRTPVPGWLKEYKKTGDKVKLNRGKLVLYKKRLAKDENLRIPGSADQARGKKTNLNMILFCKPVIEK